MDGLNVVLHVAKKAESETEKRRRRDLERKHEAARKQKEADDIAYKKLWGWREDGQVTALNVRVAFAGVKAILIPHKSKKIAMLEFESIIARTLEDRSKCWMRLSRRLLDTIRPYSTLYRQKYRSIRRKHVVIREIHNNNRASESLHMKQESDFSYDYPHTEDQALQPMEAAYARRVPVGPAKVMLLRMLRAKVEDALNKLQRTLNGIDRCELMLVCTSVYHERLSGCPKCGLVLVKGIMHLESFDRVTNTTIIVPRDYEMGILAQEKAHYTALYTALRGQLQTVEAELRLKTVFDIQAWWATRMAIRKARTQRLSMEKSLRRRRIRRLVRMKRAVDTFDPWASTLEELELAYCDLLPELAEYRQYKSKKSIKIALKFARYILDVAKKKHAAAVFQERYRERRRYERLASAEMQRQREKRVEQSLRHQLLEKTKMMLARTWMCARFECNKRVFLSEFRYTTHMKLHRLKDTKGMKSREELYLLNVARRRKEELFMQRVRLLREGVDLLRGEGVEGSCSPMKSAHVHRASRRYLTKLPALPAETGGGRKHIDDVIGRDHRNGESVTANDLLDEYELHCLLSESKESDEPGSSAEIYDDEKRSYEECNAFDELILHVAPSDMDVSGCDDDGMDALPGKGGAGEDAGEAGGQANGSTNGAEDAVANGDMKGGRNDGDVEDPSVTNNGDDADVPDTPLRPGPYSKRKMTGGLPPTSCGVVKKHGGSGDDVHSEGDKKGSLEHMIQKRQLLPAWLNMPQLTVLSESVQSNLKVYLEVVSKVESVDISSPKFVLDKHVFRIGTLPSCDYTMKCTDSGGDIRQVRRVSRIHCLLYVPLILQTYSSTHRHAVVATAGAGHGEALPRTHVPDRGLSVHTSTDDYDEVEAQRHVTIVDNHSAWGTYVVSLNGVRKVPTNIQKGLPLLPGDLICIGVVRNGPPTMSPIDANKALVVFRVRIE